MRDVPLDNGALEGFFNATVDAALALQTCVLAAETIGLGTCPISVLRNRIGEVADILELPDKVFPVAGLCVGYPAQAGFTSMRLPLEATVHIDRYDDSSLPASVDGYDRPLRIVQSTADTTLPIPFTWAQLVDLRSRGTQFEYQEIQ